MIFQRLHPNHTLSRAVAELKSGRVDHLMDEYKRSREGNISGNTGAYRQARKRLPKEITLAAATCIFDHFCPPADEQLLFHGYRIFAVDGTHLHVPDTPELLAAFPPGSNQCCQSTRPIVQLVVAHDLVTGTDVIPVWGVTEESGFQPYSCPKLGYAVVQNSGKVTESAFERLVWSIISCRTGHFMALVPNLVENSSYSQIVAFIWDDSRRYLLRAGLRQLRGVVDAVIVSRPGSMTT